MNKLLTLLLLLVSLVSCNSFQKALKSNDIAEKNNVANELFEKGKYSKAIRLYDQITPSYRGKPQGERLFYMNAKALYELGKKSDAYYVSAAYQLGRFAADYPASEKREEALFLEAESYYKLSPTYSLDQDDSDIALSKLQRFIDVFPESIYVEKANNYVKELSEKIDYKAFEIAKQYYQIGNFKSAIKVMDNFILDHPGTKFKEEALYYKFLAAHDLAMNSVENKKQDRLDVAKKAYLTLIKFNESSEFKEQADKKFVDINNNLQKYSN